ncbi:MAG: recombinase family protein, partial [Clostridia bacterium]|nr:recombinase family protein [Clostridia bacterium]
VGQYTDYLFPTYNIRFIAVGDNVDSAMTENTGMDMTPIMNVFNEWHAANTSKKIKAVIEANAKEGIYRCSYAPYGYIKGDDEKRLPVVDSEAAAYVRRIFEMRASGVSPNRIAQTFNDEGILPTADYKEAKYGIPNTRKTHHLWSVTAIRQHPETVTKRTDNPDTDKEIGDSVTLRPVLSDFFAAHKDFHHSTFISDSACDSYDNYSMLKNEFGFSRAVIPMNTRNSKSSNACFDASGTPICPQSGEKFQFLGKSGGENRSLRFKWVCPKSVSVPKTGSRVCTCDTPCTDSTLWKMCLHLSRKGFSSLSGRSERYGAVGSYLQAPCHCGENHSSAERHVCLG